MTRNSAASLCSELDGFLATISSAQLAFKLADYFSTFEYYWIGYRQSACSSPWMWDDGDSSSYVNWASGYPQCFERGPQTPNCAYMNNPQSYWGSAHGGWATSGCNVVSYYGLCESIS